MSNDVASDAAGHLPGRTSRWRVKRLGQWFKDHSLLLKLIGKVAIVASVVGAVILGVLALRSEPIAPVFTRVGGNTSVGTAVDASRLWLTPPKYYVITPAGASQQIMLGAAQCAMVHDAPLLFQSSDTKRKGLVKATIKSWQATAAGTGTGPPIPHEFIRNLRDVASCMTSGHPAFGNRLSIFEVPNRPAQRSEFPKLPRLCSSEPPGSSATRLRSRRCAIPARALLAHVVVFAAAIAPWRPPDIAVGLALTAHMATAGREVSLVVVPRYLEADSQLEHLLRSQRGVVTGGIVLGQTPTVPEDTRALLGQLLTPRDRLGQLVADLTSVGGFVVALLGLLLGLGAVAAPQTGELMVLLADRREERVKMRRQKQEIRQQQKEEETKERKKEMAAAIGSETMPPPTEQADWAADLSGREVTVWLRSGWRVTGAMKGLHRADLGHDNDRVVMVLRLEEAKLASEDDLPQKEANAVLMPVEGIELIGVGVRDA